MKTSYRKLLGIRLLGIQLLRNLLQELMNKQLLNKPLIKLIYNLIAKELTIIFKL